MSKPLTDYFSLMEKYPSLFENPVGEDVIQIIKDPEEILQYQSKIQSENKKNNKPTEWIDLGILVDDPWYIVVRDLVRFPNGYVGGYIRFLNRKTLEGGTSVVILPVLNGNILLISHFRHDTRHAHWELPSGFGEPGIDSRQNALKELYEEIGANPRRLIEMTTENESEDSRFSYYLAELESDQEIKVDIGEGIGKYELLKPSEFEQWVKNGTITDSNAIKAYLLAITQGYLTRDPA